MTEEGEVRKWAATALATAERVLPLLPQRSGTFKRAQEALADARRWFGGEAISARRIYDHLRPLTLLAEDDGLMGKELPAFNSVLCALYYVTLEADTEQSERGDSNYEPLGNDMFCSGEASFYDQCLAHAEEAERA